MKCEFCLSCLLILLFFFKKYFNFLGECSNKLKLIGVSLDDRGQYRCAITLVPSYKTQDSQTATLEVVLPDTTEQFDELEFSHEDVKILQQPSLPFQNVKAAIGEKVHLTCLAGCKYGLKYEWLKRGVRTDLIGIKVPVLYIVGL